MVRVWAKVGADREECRAIVPQIAPAGCSLMPFKACWLQSAGAILDR
jgi:hypothetical protein